MLSNFLSKTRPINYLTILFLLLFFFFVVVFRDDNLRFNLATVFKILMNITALFFSVLLINFVIRKNLLTKDNSFALFFVVMFFIMFPSTMTWSVMFLANVFLLISLRRVYSLKNNGRIPIKVFDAGFWLGISVLFYNNLILFWIIILLGLIFYKRMNLKNIIISIFGLAIPIFLYYVFCLIFNQLPNFFNLFKFDFNSSIVFYGKLSFLIPISIIFSLLIWSIISITLGVNLVNAKNRSSWYLILFNLMIGILISFTSIYKTGSELVFLFFPASVILANYLQKEKDSWFRNMVLLLVFFIGIGIYFL